MLRGPCEPASSAVFSIAVMDVDVFSVCSPSGLAAFRGPVLFPLYLIFRKVHCCLYVRVYYVAKI